MPFTIVITVFMVEKVNQIRWLFYSFGRMLFSPLFCTSLFVSFVTVFMLFLSEHRELYQRLCYHFVDWFTPIM